MSNEVFFMRERIQDNLEAEKDYIPSPGLHPDQGWARSWWNNRSFSITNGTIKNDPIVPKKNESSECVLKNFGTISKRRERNRTGIA